MADQKLILYRGEDANLLFTPTTTVNTNITGWDLEFSIAVPGSPPILQKLTPTDISITSAADGKFTVFLTRANTATLTLTTYLWDVWRINAGSYQRLAGGQIQMLRPVLPSS